MKNSRPNILFITADDMNWDSVGAYGCKVSKTTPNIDRLASEGMMFRHAHVTVAICQPSRGVLATGLYPHCSGIEGFNHIENDVPTITEYLREAGYLNCVLGKVDHSTPKTSFKWDLCRERQDLGQGRDPALYHKFAGEFIAAATAANKPFLLMANSHDPHRPFFGSDRDFTEPPPPSHVFSEEEVEVPGFLPELPEVRKEMAEYYSSVRRCDDSVGAVLRALEESGQEENTLVMFLSDNGMALPFAKTNCYLNSTRTPWIVRWPEVVKPGQVDEENIVSGIDFLPTVLDAVGITPKEETDGVSFLPLLKGEAQDKRGLVFTQIHETNAKNRYPMRCVQSRQFGYIFNAWSDKKRVFKNESQGGRTFNAMKEAAAHDPDIAARVKLFQYRVVEELYNFEKDPDALNNLADDPQYKTELDKMRSELRNWMKETKDPALEAFEKRDSAEALEEFMASQEERSKEIGREYRGR